MLRSVRGGRIELLQASELRGRAVAAARVLVDLGTGDGSFPYREARDHPDALCIGIDPVADKLRKTSARIGRKPSRGGVANLVLLLARAEALPPALDGLATRVTVLFPWSGLLRALVIPDLEVLAGLRRLLVPEGVLEVLINLQVFEDDAYRQRQGLPRFEPNRTRPALAEAYREAGLQLCAWDMLEPGPLPLRTTWGQHLSLGSGRPSLRLVARSRGTPHG